MADLKYLLKQGRLVEIKSNKGGIRLGIVDCLSGYVKTDSGRHGFYYIQDDLKMAYCKITKVFDYQDGELIKVWDRDSYVDWSAVEVDTKIEVHYGNGCWVRKYFAKYEDGKIFSWSGGDTSFTANGWMTFHGEARLYKEERED